MVETIDFENVHWHHIVDPSEKDYNYLLEEFEFHPLDIEDCRSVNQRPKIDEYDDYYFLILHFPYFDKSNQFVRIREVKIFWGKDYIVTIGKAHWVVKKLFKEMQEKQRNGNLDADTLAGSSDALLYNILDRLMVETFTLISRIGGSVDSINYDIFTMRTQTVLEQLSITRKNLIALNTTFRPQLRVFHKFESGGIKGYTEDMEGYWGDILDQYQKMFDMVEDYGELIEGLSQTFDSLQTNRTNEIIKILTILSTIMLPLTVISSIYGMNVPLPWQNNAWTFIGIAIVMMIVVTAFLLYFRKKHWL